MLQEDQPENDVLVVGWLQFLAQLVGSEEQLRLEVVADPVPDLVRRRGTGGRTDWPYTREVNA